MRALPGKPCPSLTPAEWGWCAGLFEGEGNIAFKRDCKTVILRVLSTDRDVLEKLDALWPSHGGVIVDGVTKAGNPIYTWSVGQRDRVRGFLDGIYPHLCSRRRARADEAYLRLAKIQGRRWKLAA